MNRVLNIVWIYVLAGFCYQLQALSGMQARASVNFMGFQLVNPGLIVGSPCLWFGLLDEGSCGWKHGFRISVGYDF